MTMRDIRHPSAPATALPAGATDCHMHAYLAPSERPTDAAAAFPPVPHGSIENYLRVQKRLGLSRAVVVQPSVYGFDNSPTLAAMATLGANGRGIAVVPPDVSDNQLIRLTNLGVRGVRFFMLSGGALPWDCLPGLAARVAQFGWHVQLQTDGRKLADHAAMLHALPCRLVIDHNGKFLAPVETTHAGFRTLLELVDRGNTWVKTSGVYETSVEGAPDYADVSALAKKLIEVAPERCLFATNWPHPTKPHAPPDDGHLIDLFMQWCGNARTAARIMVDNAAEVYGFERAT
ncbi:hydrolase [Caballeronia temeraria]|uniref:Hydrolase n=1 Tax=Caballeronia temeraria TaxID=1777137 RepID=A0A158CNH5_9BURK|nr:amidohydrolase family protein [Caballeronia temeraria]SAK83851.1 hydrolase [Caballeronia temeraria]